MKTNQTIDENGSVLITAMMTMTILAMICATGLYISSQNSGTGMQTAGWQQALTAAESGVDAAVRALNAQAASGGSPWSNWKSVLNSSVPTLPTIEPTSASTSASSLPDGSHYNLLPSSSMTLSLPNTEGSNSVSAWVTIDTAGGNLTDPSGKQWYRIRSTGKAIYPTGSSLLTRVSNNRLDNELRNSIAMNFNRRTASSTAGNTAYTGPTRTIEAIMSPQGGGTSIWGNGIVLKNALTMSGGGTIDHFDSTNATLIAAATAAGKTATAQFLTSPSIYRSTDYTETLIGILNANGSNLSNTYVYGGISYSTTGAVPQNTTHVEGTISTPYAGTPPTTSNPTWTPDVTYAAGSPPFSTIQPNSTNTLGLPYKVKVTGNFTVPGGKTLAITAPSGATGTTYLEIWITGSFTTSGSGVINQANGVHVTYFVDGSVTTSGGSFNNASGEAQNNQMVVVGSGSVTVSGTGTYIGTIEAPLSAVTVSGSGAFTGGLIANTLNISGGASFHEDDALSSYKDGINGSGGSPASYAFANWFEDNSDPARNALDTNFAPHAIVY